ncbi:hypothetical protein ABKN59_010522 [Abortiporus biennis]
MGAPNFSSGFLSPLSECELSWSLTALISVVMFTRPGHLQVNHNTPEFSGCDISVNISIDRPVLQEASPHQD